MQRTDGASGTDTSWTEALSRGFANVSDYFLGQNNAVNNALHTRFAGTKSWSAYQLYLQEIRLLEVSARQLVKGGSISDSEAKAAADTIATGQANGSTTKQQLQTVISRNNDSIKKLMMKPYTSNAQIHQPTGKDQSVAAESKAEPQVTSRLDSKGATPTESWSDAASDVASTVSDYFEWE